MLQLTPEMRTAMAKIVLSTTDVSGFEPIDIVFTTVPLLRLGEDSVQEALAQARDELRLAAVSASADAVLGCRFEVTAHVQRAFNNQAMLDSATFTVHGYGTAARRRGAAYGDRF